MELQIDGKKGYKGTGKSGWSKKKAAKFFVVIIIIAVNNDLKGIQRRRGEILIFNLCITNNNFIIKISSFFGEISLYYENLRLITNFNYFTCEFSR